MSDHDFERQVKTTMDELKLKPSLSVWEAVEADLEKRKRRHRGFILLPVLLLLLATSGYFLISENNSLSPVSTYTAKSDTQVAADADVDQNKKLPPSSDKTGFQNQPAKEVIAYKTSEPETQKLNTQKLKKELPSLETLKTNQNKISTSGKKNLRNSSKKDSESHVVLPPNSGDKNEIAESVKRSTALIPVLRNERRANILVNQVNSEIFVESKDPRTLDEQRANLMQKLQPPFDSLVAALSLAKAKPSAKNHKWQFGVSGSAGISNIKQGNVFDLRQAAVSDISMSAPGNVFTPNFGINYSPSVIKPRPAYSFSIFAQRVINNRLSVSIGVGYTQFNTAAYIGRRVDSVAIVNNGARGFSNVAMYYRPEKTDEYRMSYHFIDIPITATYRINRSKKVPIFANAGITASRLIKTNALHFDGSTGVYYKNNDLFNKLHIGASTGVSIGLLNNTRTPITIGPTVRYQVSRLLQKDVSGANHLISFGAELKMLLRK